MHYYIYHLLSSPQRSYYYLYFKEEKMEAEKCYIVSGCGKLGANTGALSCTCNHRSSEIHNELPKQKCVRK